MRRESKWIAIAATETAISGANSAVLFTGFSAVDLGLRPFTIVRSRGFFSVMSDQIAASERWGASIGMAVVSDQAFAIGVTAVPTPETDRDSDLWYVYETLMGRVQFVSSTGITLYGATPWIQYDSRAMRKVEEGQDCAIVVETNSVSNGVQISKAGRMLIKLH